MTITTMNKTPRPTELTPQQISMIAVGANNVPPSWRERFRAQIADNLLNRRQPLTNADIQQAIGAAHRVIVLGAGTPDLDPDDYQ
jgi:hypothetical protein